MLTFRPKIIFFDIDDTLYHKGHGVHPETQSALARVQAQGITLAIATGRSPSVFPEAVKTMMQDLHIDTVVSINGQYTTHQSALLQNNAISHSDLTEIKALCATKGWEYGLISHQKMAVSRDNQTVANALTPIGKYEVNPNYDQESPIYQVLLFIRDEEEAQIASHDLLNRYKTVRWHPDSVDLLHKNMSKALGIQLVCDKLGISPKECIAFGDGLNDMEMFDTVGFSVAMNNAHESLKARADYITETTSNNGIAKALFHLNLL